MSFFSTECQLFHWSTSPWKISGSQHRTCSIPKRFVLIYVNIGTSIPCTCVIDQINWHHPQCTVADCRCTVVLFYVQAKNIDRKESSTCRRWLLVGTKGSNKSYTSVINKENCQFCGDKISSSHISSHSLLQLHCFPKHNSGWRSVFVVLSSAVV